MTDVKSPNEARRTPLATKIGLGLLAVAVLWWFVYYAQWEGAFGLLDLKIMCLGGAITMECRSFQEWIHTGIPTYSPFLWYAGLIAVVIGFFHGLGKGRRG